ncbi:unnamed protein product, partial [marine sediment metagenome]
PQILRMLGLISNTKMFHHKPFSREYNWEKYGLGELVTICSKVIKNDDSPTSENIKAIYNQMDILTAKKISSICEDLYGSYIKDKVTVAMPKPKRNYRLERANMFLE